MMSRFVKKKKSRKPHWFMHQDKRLSTFQLSNLPVSCIDDYFKDTDALFNRHWTDDYDYSYGTMAPSLHIGR